MRLVQSEEVTRRELLEEVGGTTAELHYLGQFHTSSGILNEPSYVYLHTGVEPGKTHCEATELMETHLVPAKRGQRRARDKRRVAIEGEISDGPSALALL